VFGPSQGAAKKNTSPKELALAGSYFAPGVILRPLVKPRRQLFFLPPGAHSRSASAPLTGTLNIPFTGEYQVFPTSSARLQHDWAEESGSLLENTYETAGVGSLETEAYQKLDPPMDLGNGAKVRLELVSGEDAPLGISLQLVTAGGVVDLGFEVCCLDRHARETVDFTVPAGLPSLQVKAIRAAFHRLPRQGKQSMKVDIRQFTLEPNTHQ
jgi:hypothetical protein